MLLVLSSVVTPLTWVVDKVASKFSDVKAEGVGNSYPLGKNS